MEKEHTKVTRNYKSSQSKWLRNSKSGTSFVNFGGKAPYTMHCIFQNIGNIIIIMKLLFVHKLAADVLQACSVLSSLRGRRNPLWFGEIFCWAWALGPAGTPAKELPGMWCHPGGETSLVRNVGPVGGIILYTLCLEGGLQLDLFNAETLQPYLCVKRRKQQRQCKPTEYDVSAIRHPLWCYIFYQLLENISTILEWVAFSPAWPLTPGVGESFPLWYTYHCGHRGHVLGDAFT